MKPLLKPPKIYNKKSSLKKKNKSKFFKFFSIILASQLLLGSFLFRFVFLLLFQQRP